MDQISNVDWIWWRLEQCIDADGIFATANALGRHTHDIRRTLTVRRCTLNSLLKLTKFFDLSVAELMLAPDIDTEWYRDTKIDYLMPNLTALCEEKAVTSNDIAAGIGMTRDTVQTWFNGKNLPRTDTVQKLADYFGVEVADLFLPPEGGV